MAPTEILTTLLLTWNIVTFALMAVDKGKAENKEFRISEKFFFTSAFLFGAFGILSGMYVFRHKTKHRSFRILIPIAVTTNIIVIILLSKNI